MNDDWLSKEISQIMTSPHISFPKGPFRMGPGPVDLFSTRFNNAFAPGVKVTMAGEEVSREQLKAKLLDLQKYWKAEEVKFEGGPRSETVISFPSGKTVFLSAQTEVEGGRRVIKKFSLDEDNSFFE